MSRNLRMRGTHRRVRSADNYGHYRLIDAGGNPVTQFLPLDQIEQFLLTLCDRSNGRTIGRIEIPPYRQEAIAVAP